MAEAFRGLNIVDMNSQRCDLETHCDVGVRLKRHERKLEQNPGITIKTDADEVAELVTGVPKGHRWDAALGKAVVLIGRLTRTETPDVVDNNIITLFDGLRDPDRRRKTMQRVEILYDEQVSATRK